MAGFHIVATKPEDVRAMLADPEKHWVPGYSAFETANAWVSAGDIPTTVRAVLNTDPVWRDARLIDAFFERKTDLGTAGFPSQTDLLALVALADGNAVIGVEGKVRESFGPLVKDWLAVARGANRRRRLDALCATLALDPSRCGDLYYQLFHRTAAAIYEARRFGYRRALMLIHSFSTVKARFTDFAAFAAALNLPVVAPDMLAGSKLCDGTELWIGWASDTPTVDIDAQISGGLSPS